VTEWKVIGGLYPFGGPMTQLSYNSKYILVEFASLSK